MMYEVARRSLPPDTLSQGFRGRWTAEKDTWNTFAGIPCQVDGRERHLEHFRGNSVPGGRQERTPGTLSREFRVRWEAGRCHLEHFRGISVPGGRQRRTPGTLLQEFRARWKQGDATWNAFAEIPYQVGYLSAGTYCGTPSVLPALRAPSLLGSRCRLRHLYTPDISQDTGLKL